MMVAVLEFVAMKVPWAMKELSGRKGMKVEAVTKTKMYSCPAIVPELRNEGPAVTAVPCPTGRCKSKDQEKNPTNGQPLR